jgi:DNA processing protein
VSFDADEWLLRLNSVAFSEPEIGLALLGAVGAENLARASDADWAAGGGMGLERAARWRREALAFDADGERRLCDAFGARLIYRGRSGYPELLAGLPDAPLLLYARGPMRDAATVAMVGSRAPTAYGRRIARRFSGELARRGVTVVSGLARGIDAESHAAALDARGATWAVLGSGLCEVYPPENRDLARRIPDEGGAVLSEYPLRARANRVLFPRRNRIVAGLSLATVVVEGRMASGSRSTAEKAAEYGRELLAVPGPADSPLSEIPHHLLRSGARLAARCEDVLAALPVGAARNAVYAAPRAARPCDADESRVLRFLGGDSLSLDELSRMTGLDTPSLSTIMFGLELKDLVSAVPGQRYAKKTV